MFSFSFTHFSEEIGPKKIQMTDIQGVINSYGAISSITDDPGCMSSLMVDDASGFTDGGMAMVIQMQGAVMDETNSSSFGNIIDLGSTGLYEKVAVLAVSGNQITTTKLINDYQIEGKVQIVSIPQYDDATVTNPIVPIPWNGEKGGVIALEVSGTLTLNSHIHASANGFRGGVRTNASSGCGSFNNSPDYYYPITSYEGEQKGEGIVPLIEGKEHGRGAQANGGGGGNDHNAGGGGGAGYTNGGAGGTNDDPSLFTCDGMNPGQGGKAISFTDRRLFLGGGGGAGHDNNNAGSDGGKGGGIVYVAANTIVGNWQEIRVNGQDVDVTIQQDGGGGGGGAGMIILDVNTLSGTLRLKAEGGKGSDTNNLIAGAPDDRCMGPGGGGGGGAIFTNISLPELETYMTGGQSGVVTNSSAGCIGSSNGATSGSNGQILPFSGMPTNPGESTSFFSYTGCDEDGFSTDVGGTTFNQNNPTGMVTLTGQYGCDSIVTIDLDYLPRGESTVSPTICSDESYTLGNTVYDINNPTGVYVIDGGSANGCDSLVNVDVSFHPAITLTENTVGDEVTITAAGGMSPFTYNWSNGDTGETNTLSSTGTYTVTVTDGNDCTEEITFNFVLTTSNQELEETYGIKIFPNPVQENLFITMEEISKNWRLELQDISGKELMDKEMNSSPTHIDTSIYPQGIYILKIILEDGVYSKKIMIKG